MQLSGGLQCLILNTPNLPDSCLHLSAAHECQLFADTSCTAAAHCNFCSSFVPLCWLQTARLHFGVILGWSCMASISIWFVVNSMVSSLCHSSPNAARPTDIQIGTCTGTIAQLKAQPGFRCCMCLWPEPEHCTCLCSPGGNGQPRDQAAAGPVQLLLPVGLLHAAYGAFCPDVPLDTRLQVRVPIMF